MKTSLLAVALVLVGGAAIAADPAPTPRDPTAEIFDLKKGPAEKRGKADAEKDFAAGRYRILVYGLRAGTRDPKAAASPIRVEAIAGCVVSEGLLAYADSYNKTMRPLLEKKFGAEAVAAAR